MGLVETLDETPGMQQGAPSRPMIVSRIASIVRPHSLFILFILSSVSESILFSPHPIWIFLLSPSCLLISSGEGVFGLNMPYFRVAFLIFGPLGLSRFLTVLRGGILNVSKFLTS